MSNEIRAVYSENTIRIYQAYDKNIAEEAVIRGTFGDVFGNPLEYRSIQLGLRGKALYHYVNDWIVHIENITQYVNDLRDKRDVGIDISPYIPQEKIYIKQYKELMPELFDK